VWVSACYTKTTKEIQRSRRERARSENERRLHRSTTTTTTTEGETDGRTSSSSSPPFPIIICPKPHSTFFPPTTRIPRTTTGTRLAPNLRRHPTDARRRLFFLAFHAHPTPRIARVHSPGPRFRVVRMRMSSHAVVKETARKRDHKISRRKNRETRENARPSPSRRDDARKKERPKSAEKKKGTTTTFGRTWNGMVDDASARCA